MSNTKNFSRPHGRAGAPPREKTLNVLIACEESQAECVAFRELGHRAFFCENPKCYVSASRGKYRS